MKNELALPALMPPSHGEDYPKVRIFKKRRIPSARGIRILIALFTVTAAVLALFLQVLSGARGVSEGSETQASPPTNAPTAESTESPSEEGESLPVFLPETEISLPESTKAALDSEGQKETEPISDSDTENISIPEGAFPIKEAVFSSAHAPTVNYTAHRFDISSLRAMASAVISPGGSGPAVLVISSHTSECFLPAGAGFYDPNSHETHTDDPEKNLTAIAGIFTAALEENGIKVIHITAQCDSEGSSRAYINAGIEISKALAKYPSIKYVIDIDRAVSVDADGALLRSTVSLGSRDYAPITLSVSGGKNLGYSKICQNLALALRLNEMIFEQSESLSRPVLICDAAYTDGYSPRCLKVEIGSYTSSFDEAAASASMLGELFALLLNS